MDDHGQLARIMIVVALMMTRLITMMTVMMIILMTTMMIITTMMDRGVRHGWTSGRSMFEWADKGAWRCRTDEKEDLDGRKFRIGFEPLFVDFTKEGAVYIIFLLVKWFVLGIVAGAWLLF